MADNKLKRHLFGERVNFVKAAFELDRLARLYDCSQSPTKPGIVNEAYREAEKISRSLCGKLQEGVVISESDFLEFERLQARIDSAFQEDYRRNRQRYEEEDRYEKLYGGHSNEPDCGGYGP